MLMVMFCCGIISLIVMFLTNFSIKHNTLWPFYVSLTIIVAAISALFWVMQNRPEML